MGSERRRSPRIEILGRVHGQAVSLDVPLTVREISLGGMSFDVAVAFPIDTIHEFRLTLGDGSTVLLRGRVVYCRAFRAADGQMFVCGVHFVDDEPITGQSVNDVIDRIS